MKVWDAKALLLLRPGVLPDIRCSRVFGSFKSPGKFRQRPARVNSLESRLDGVSHLLPQGFMLTKVHAPRFTHQLRGSTTHRKDFYSQCMVTREHAFSNAVKPSFVLRDFAGTRAYDEYVAWAQHDAGLLCNRRFCPGPREAPGASLRASLLHPGAPVHDVSPHCSRETPRESNWQLLPTALSWNPVASSPRLSTAGCWPGTP